MLLRREAAPERILAGPSSPMIRDVIRVRKFVPRTAANGEGVCPCLKVVKVVLDHKLRPLDCRWHDLVRILESIAWHLGCEAGVLLHSAVSFAVEAVP